MEWIKNWFGRKGLEYHEVSYDVKSIGNIILPETLTNANAFTLANIVSELFFPVDFCADRVSKVRYYIADKNGKEITNTELNRFVSTEINPLYSFADLIYNYMFSLLADGNAINYLQGSNIGTRELTVNTIYRWDVLNPKLVEMQEYSNISTLGIKALIDLIRSAKYNETGVTVNLQPSSIFISNSSMQRRGSSMILSPSMLMKANKSIDTLLSVYSARYNVYANNGAAGYLSKKQSSANGSAFESAIMEGSQRDAILKDINDRNGLTGKRNLWGISGVPIEFINTLATIKDLMPFEETLEDSIKIASVFQIPSVLVPQKDYPTFSNIAAAERAVWENSLLSLVGTMCDDLTRMFKLDKIKYQVMADTSNVSALVANEKDNAELMMLELNNLKALKELSPETDIEEMIKDLYVRYGRE